MSNNTEGIVTTGGIFSASDKERVLEAICDVFNCQPDEIRDLKPIQSGLTNIVLTFKYNGGKYVYRHPGVGSDILVDRSRESIVQKQIADVGVDTTLVAMSVVNGWRVAKFIQNDGFNYKDLNHMVRAMILLRKLHSAKVRVRYEYNIMDKVAMLRDKIAPEKYGSNYPDFPEFDEIRANAEKLFELSKHDGINKTFTHGDCRDENFLINKDEIYLIDWEYGGYGDPGFDIGSYVAGTHHTDEEVDRILFTYFGHKPTKKEYRHFIAWIGITGYFYMHWTLWKEFCGQRVERLKGDWYYFALNYTRKALKMYEE